MTTVIADILLPPAPSRSSSRPLAPSLMGMSEIPQKSPGSMGESQGNPTPP